MRGASANPSMTQRSERSDHRTGGQYGGGAPDTGHAVYVPNPRTMKPESEMTVAQGGNHTNENPGDSADTESEASAVPVDAMTAECPSRHRRRSSILSRCRNDSTSHRAFRTITTEVLSSKLTPPRENSVSSATPISSPRIHEKIEAMRTGFGVWIRDQIDARVYESTEEAARALGGVSVVAASLGNDRAIAVPASSSAGRSVVRCAHTRRADRRRLHDRRREPPSLPDQDVAATNVEQANPRRDMPPHSRRHRRTPYSSASERSTSHPRRWTSTP